MNCGKVEIFLKYSNRTDYQYCVYIPDTKNIIQAITVIFNKKVQGVVVDLY